MKVLVVSGFLGSGKTRFIGEFAKNFKNIAILENDYAKANIDKDILKNQEQKVLAIEEGCICCNLKSDFASTILTLANTLDVEYLIVEPTGLGFLSKVLDNIKKIEYENIKVLGPICIVDYYQIENNLKENREIFIDQIKNSSNILLSKIENISNEDIDHKANELRKYTKANILKTHYDSFDKDDFNKLINEFDLDLIDSTNFKEMDMDYLSYKNVSYKSFQQMGVIFNAICQERFGKVLRAKGFVKVEGKRVKIDIINSTFYLEKYDKNVKDNLVFIGDNLDKNAFDTMFKKDKITARKIK